MSLKIHSDFIAHIAPTHNLTLTRTAMEVVDLHNKLKDSHPNSKLPNLPIDASTVPTPPAKRKSNFLNTLSRLASPSSNRVGKTSSSRHHSSASLTTIPSTLPTPIAKPSSEVVDPFASFTGATEGLDSSTLSSSSHANSAITGLASYLTTISNESTLHHSRHWKRFVRVRTDDLESVRVERAIKRVRSDLASHVVPKSPIEPKASSGSAGISTPEKVKVEAKPKINGDISSSIGSLRDEGIAEEEEGTELHTEALREDLAMEEAGEETNTSTEAAEGEVDAPASIDHSKKAIKAIEEEPLTTPVATESVAARKPRSQSADPDKASRLSRVYQNQQGAASQTGDESSISTAAGESSDRKKRSRSSDPNKQLKKSQRKVVINDFEMMRVLGKGCAGKVLLVRHKSSADLYALKAITKRHVLAHQELQHTLTEQAVLKRMAAGSKDPFVVKLWWSFHDKENLFLVMVGDR